MFLVEQERGSGNAYRYLAKENGLLKELAQESYEEGEAVWIFLPGEVQPRRASVMEDTPEDAALILVEFWDDDDPPSHVERCRPLGWILVCLSFLGAPFQEVTGWGVSLCIPPNKFSNQFTAYRMTLRILVGFGVFCLL